MAADLRVGDKTSREYPSQMGSLELCRDILSADVLMPISYLLCPLLCVCVCVCAFPG